MAAVRSLHVLIFTQQFASMIRSNLQLVDVLDNLAEETPQRPLREAIDAVCDDVRHGVDLGQAMADHPNLFDDVYVNVVRSGMESGRLAEALAQMADYQKVIHETGRKVRSALTYPLFIVGAFIMVFNAQVFFILPRFEVMFKSFNRALPWPTQVLLDIGAVWKGNWHFILAGTAIVAVGFAVWVSTPDGRAVWDRLKLHIPLLGKLWRMSALARFLRTLAVQVQNDVPVVNALSLAADASGNLYVREVLYDIAGEVERGRSLAASFREYEIFHGIVLQMIASGEEAGILDELLMSSANYFDSLLQDMLDQITNMINPVLTVVIGLAIAGMMVASFMPVFQMGAAIG
jgi:type IV pilus assembly protein PilC